MVYELGNQNQTKVNLPGSLSGKPIGLAPKLKLDLPGLGVDLFGLTPGAQVKTVDMADIQIIQGQIAQDIKRIGSAIEGATYLDAPNRDHFASEVKQSEKRLAQLMDELSNPKLSPQARAKALKEYDRITAKLQAIAEFIQSANDVKEAIISREFSSKTREAINQDIQYVAGQLVAAFKSGDVKAAGQCFQIVEELKATVELYVGSNAQLGALAKAKGAVRGFRNSSLNAYQQIRAELRRQKPDLKKIQTLRISLQNDFNQLISLGIRNEITSLERLNYGPAWKSLIGKARAAFNAAAKTNDPKKAEEARQLLTLARAYREAQVEIKRIERDIKNAPVESKPHCKIAIAKFRAYASSLLKGDIQQAKREFNLAQEALQRANTVTNNAKLQGVATVYIHSVKSLEPTLIKVVGIPASRWQEPLRTLQELGSVKNPTPAQTERLKKAVSALREFVIVGRAADMLTKLNQEVEKGRLKKDEVMQLTLDLLSASITLRSGHLKDDHLKELETKTLPLASAALYIAQCDDEFIKFVSGDQGVPGIFKALVVLKKAVQQGAISEEASKHLEFLNNNMSNIMNRSNIRHFGKSLKGMLEQLQPLVTEANHVEKSVLKNIYKVEGEFMRQAADGELQFHVLKRKQNIEHSSDQMVRWIKDIRYISDTVALLRDPKRLAELKKYEPGVEQRIKSEIARFIERALSYGETIGDLNHVIGLVQMLHANGLLPEGLQTPQGQQEFIQKVINHKAAKNVERVKSFGKLAFHMKLFVVEIALTAGAAAIAEAAAGAAVAAIGSRVALSSGTRFVLGRVIAAPTFTLTHRAISVPVMRLMGEEARFFTNFTEFANESLKTLGMFALLPGVGKGYEGVARLLMRGGKPATVFGRGLLGTGAFVTEAVGLTAYSQTLAAIDLKLNGQNWREAISLENVGKILFHNMAFIAGLKVGNLPIKPFLSGVRGALAAKYEPGLREKINANDTAMNELLGKSWGAKEYAEFQKLSKERVALFRRLEAVGIIEMPKNEKMNAAVLLLKLEANAEILNRAGEVFNQTKNSQNLAALRSAANERLIILKGLEAAGLIQRADVAKFEEIAAPILKSGEIGSNYAVRETSTEYIIRDGKLYDPTGKRVEGVSVEKKGNIFVLSMMVEGVKKVFAQLGIVDGQQQLQPVGGNMTGPQLNSAFGKAMAEIFMEVQQAGVVAETPAAVAKPAAGPQAAPEAKPFSYQIEKSSIGPMKNYEAKEGSEVVGSLQISIRNDNGKRVLVIEIAETNKQYQRQGIYRRLLLEAIKDANPDEILSPTVTNTETVALLQRAWDQGLRGPKLAEIFRNSPLGKLREQLGFTENVVEKKTGTQVPSFEVTSKKGPAKAIEVKAGFAKRESGQYQIRGNTVADQAGKPGAGVSVEQSGNVYRLYMETGRGRELIDSGFRGADGRINFMGGYKSYSQLVQQYGESQARKIVEVREAITKSGVMVETPAGAAKGAPSVDPSLTPFVKPGTNVVKPNGVFDAKFIETMRNLSEKSPIAFVDVDETLLQRNPTTGEVTANPDAAAFLSGLKAKGYKVVIFSAKDSDGTAAKLKQAGLDSLCDLIIGREAADWAELPMDMLTKMEDLLNKQGLNPADGDFYFSGVNKGNIIGLLVPKDGRAIFVDDNISLSLEEGFGKPQAFVARRFAPHDKSQVQGKNPTLPEILSQLPQVGTPATAAKYQIKGNTVVDQAGKPMEGISVEQSGNNYKFYINTDKGRVMMDSGIREADGRIRLMGGDKSYSQLVKQYGETQARKIVEAKQAILNGGVAMEKTEPGAVAPEQGGTAPGIPSSKQGLKGPKAPVNPQARVEVADAEFRKDPNQITFDNLLKRLFDASYRTEEKANEASKKNQARHAELYKLSQKPEYMGMPFYEIEMREGAREIWIKANPAERAKLIELCRKLGLPEKAASVMDHLYALISRDSSVRDNALFIRLERMQSTLNQIKNNLDYLNKNYNINSKRLSLLEAMRAMRIRTGVGSETKEKPTVKEARAAEENLDFFKVGDGSGRLHNKAMEFKMHPWSAFAFRLGNGREIELICGEDGKSFYLRDKGQIILDGKGKPVVLKKGVEIPLTETPQDPKLHLKISLGEKVTITDSSPKGIQYGEELRSTAPELKAEIKSVISSAVAKPAPAAKPLKPVTPEVNPTASPQTAKPAQANQPQVRPGFSGEIYFYKRVDVPVQVSSARPSVVKISEGQGIEITLGPSDPLSSPRVYLFMNNGSFYIKPRDGEPRLVKNGSVLNLGSDAKKSDLVIPGAGDKHIRIDVRSEGVIITDFRTGKGTFYRKGEDTGTAQRILEGRPRRDPIMDLPEYLITPSPNANIKFNKSNCKGAASIRYSAYKGQREVGYIEVDPNKKTVLEIKIDPKYQGTQLIKDLNQYVRQSEPGVFGSQG